MWILKICLSLYHGIKMAVTYPGRNYTADYTFLHQRQVRKSCHVKQCVKHMMVSDTW